jgi:hypothetical protein
MGNGFIAGNFESAGNGAGERRDCARHIENLSILPVKGGRRAYNGAFMRASSTMAPLYS